MMNKFFAILIAAVLALSCTAAFAATYTHEDDIRFEFDDAKFEITMNDHTDDEDLVILTGKDAAWGDTFIRIHLRDLEDHETFPTMDEFTAMPDAKDLTQGEWNGFKDVFMYTVDYDDGTAEHYFIAPVTDDDGEIEDILTVNIGTSKLDDEDAAMGRDDQISAVRDTLRLDH